VHQWLLRSLPALRFLPVLPFFRLCLLVLH